MKARAILLGALLGLVVAGLVVALLRVPLAGWLASERSEASLIDSTLQSVRAQNRLNVFAARIVVVVSNERTRLGGLLSARQTLIVPGTASYEIDLSRVDRSDLNWDPATRTLTVRAPAPAVTAIAVDLQRIRKLNDGGVLAVLTDVEARLDGDNAKAAQGQLRARATAPLLIGLAREAGRDALARNFALPLAAAGSAATVAVRFADER